MNLNGIYINKKDKMLVKKKHSENMKNMGNFDKLKYNCVYYDWIECVRNTQY